MSQENPLEVPKPTGKDAIHAAGRGFLGMIPFVGSGAAEVFSWFVKEPLERRRDEWMEEVGEQLRRLADQFGIDLAELQKNDAFVDTVMQATHIAMRNRHADKRAALRNAILNSGLPDAPEESLRQMFLHWVDVLTPWHLKVLTLFHDPRKAWKAGRLMVCGLSQVLETVAPELGGKREFYDQVWRELWSAGLVDTESLHGMMSGDGALQRRTSDLGRDFLRFIAEPQNGH